MSNYPDNFSGQVLDRLHLNPADVCPVQYERIMAAQSVYKDVLKALVVSCAKNFVLLDSKAIEQAMEGVGEALYTDCDNSDLLQAGFDVSPYPDNHQKLCRDAAESILDAIRLKPVGGA